MAANHPTRSTRLILVPLQHGEALYVDPEVKPELTGDRNRWVLNGEHVEVYNGTQQDVRGVVVMQGKPVYVTGAPRDRTRGASRSRPIDTPGDALWVCDQHPSHRPYAAG